MDDIIHGRQATDDRNDERLEMTRRGKIRRYLNATHRWVGLIAGFYFVLAGITGSVLAFWQDIDEWLNQKLMTVAAPAQPASYRPIDDIIAAAMDRMPPEVKARSETPIILKFPNHARGAVQFVYMTGIPTKVALENSKHKKDSAKVDMSEVAGHTIFVDPYTATVTGERFGGKATAPLTMPFVYMMMSLHCALLWEPFGRLLIAGVGFILLMSVFVGVFLWWPKRGKWKAALTIKKNATPQRFVYDLHKTFGVYLAVVLIVSIFSGTYMNFKSPWRALASFISPVRQMRMEMTSEPANGRTPLSPSAAVGIADHAFPDGWLQMLALPRGADGAFVIGKHLIHEVNQASTHRMLVIDQYSGKILATQDPREYSAAETFFEWQYPLHSGEAFGNLGRGFILVFGFVPLILFVTGFIRWRQKRAATERTARRQLHAAAPRI